MHGLYYYKQNNDHTNLWMKIILSCGMMTVPFLVWLSMVWFSYHFWYAQCKQWIHTYFGMKFIPLFLLCRICRSKKRQTLQVFPMPLQDNPSSPDVQNESNTKTIYQDADLLVFIKVTTLWIHLFGSILSILWCIMHTTSTQLRWPKCGWTNNVHTVSCMYIYCSHGLCVGCHFLIISSACMCT